MPKTKPCHIAQPIKAATRRKRMIFSIILGCFLKKEEGRCCVVMDVIHCNEKRIYGLKIAPIAEFGEKNIHYIV